MSTDRTVSQDKAKPASRDDKAGTGESYAYRNRFLSSADDQEPQALAWKDDRGDVRDGAHDHYGSRYTSRRSGSYHSSRNPVGGRNPTTSSAWHEFYPPPYPHDAYGFNPYPYAYRGDYDHPPWGEPPSHFDDLARSTSPFPFSYPGEGGSRSWAEEHGYEVPPPPLRYSIPPISPTRNSMSREESNPDLSSWAATAATPTRSNRPTAYKPRASRRLQLDPRPASATRQLIPFYPPNDIEDEGGLSILPAPSSTASTVTEDDDRTVHRRNHRQQHRSDHYHSEELRHRYRHISDELRSPPRKFIEKVGEWDVLCGRGVPTKSGNGNKFFRTLVRKDQVEYISCRRVEKPPIATKIIDIIRSKGGRFLRRVKMPDGGPSSSGGRERYGWIELADNRVYEKVCQALRDGAPQIRQRMLELDSKEIKEEPFSPDKENVENKATKRAKV